MKNDSKISLQKRYDNLVKSVPTRAPIFLPTDRVPLEEKVEGMTRVKSIYDDKLDKIYRPALKALREHYRGSKRCFIIGNGPSLNETDLTVLENEITFAVNGFFLKASDLSWSPTFYVVEDHLVAEDRKDRINSIEGPIKLFPAYLAYCLEEGENTVFFNHRPRVSYPDGFDFSLDASDVTYTGCTVTNTCLQLAHYFGFEQIYLIGVDANYLIPTDVNQGADYSVGVLDMPSDDPNHFHPDYFGKGFRWHDPQVNKMIEAYQEAKKVTDTTDRRIYNATVGGELEVFERKSFSSLFPEARNVHQMRIANEKLAGFQRISKDGSKKPVQFAEQTVDHQGVAKSAYPNILVFDTTLIGNGTATGELKKNIFDEWPEENLLQFYGVGDKKFGAFNRGFTNNRAITKRAALKEIENFCPDIILFRPVPENLALHNFAMEFINRNHLPLISWIMDDWPRRLEKENYQLFQILERDFRKVLRRSALNLSICDAMSSAFQSRYGQKFTALSNGVNLAEWPKKTNLLNKRRVSVRYAGSLAGNMSLYSISRIARAIEELSLTHDIQLEIQTNQQWKSSAEKHFNGLKSVSINTRFLEADEYRDWLQDADIVIIGYNFDNDSVDYTQYSFANKLPEYLGSGAVVLIHGPEGQATVEYIKAHQCGAAVTVESEGALISEFKRIIEDRAYRDNLTLNARNVVASNHNLEHVKADFFNSVRKAIFIGPDPIQLKRTETSVSIEEFSSVNALSRKKRDANLDKNQPLIGPLSRAEEAHWDEVDGVSKIFDVGLSGRTMIDVGAHHGSALMPFLDKKWDIFAFEPDDQNRVKLLDRLQGHRHKEKVVLDKRCVSNVSDKNVDFFASGLSSGISGLSAFHDSHELSQKVSVTTLTDFFEKIDMPEIDFLKIDTEGHDLFVLEGFPWSRCEPSVIVCEFEDSKTLPLGYKFHDLAQFLVNKEYTVYVSEWHPIRQYGVRHHWRQLSRYPCELADARGWGNLLAFKEPIEERFLVRTFQSRIKNKAQNFQPEVAGTFFPWLSKNRYTHTANARGNMIQPPARKRRLTITDKSKFKILKIYDRLVDYLREKQPMLHMAGQFLVWNLRTIKRAPVKMFLGLGIPAVLVILPFSSEQVAIYSLIFWSFAALLTVAVFGLLVAGFAKQKFRDFVYEYDRLQRNRERQIISTARKQAKQEIELRTATNFEGYQKANRKLTDEHINIFMGEWAKKLSIQPSSRSLAYQAHRICLIDTHLRGRLAASLEDMLLRCLIVSSIKSRKVRVLEIGTLFGASLAAIHDHNKTRFDSISISAIDPLDGYYGKDNLDVVTNEPISENIFWENLEQCGIQKNDVKLLKMLSTDKAAIKAASKPLQDVLIIDGDHTYEGVKADFENYLSAVKLGGYIIFDDYNSPEWPSVKEFVDTYVQNHHHVEFVGASWRTAVFRLTSKPTNKAGSKGP